MNLKDIGVVWVKIFRVYSLEFGLEFRVIRVIRASELLLTGISKQILV